MTETAVCVHCKKPVTQETVWIDDDKDIYSSVICAGREDGVGHEPSHVVPEAPEPNKPHTFVDSGTTAGNSGIALCEICGASERLSMHTLDVPAAQAVPIPERWKFMYGWPSIIGVEGRVTRSEKRLIEELARAEAIIAELKEMAGELVRIGEKDDWPRWDYWLPKLRAVTTGKES